MLPGNGAMRCPVVECMYAPQGDFFPDQLAQGNKLWILTIVDTQSPLCSTTDARFFYPLADRGIPAATVRRGEDVFQTLERDVSRFRSCQVLPLGGLAFEGPGQWVCGAFPAQG